MVAISFLLVLPITTQAGEIPSAVPGTSVTTLARMLGSGDQSEFKEAHTQLEGLGQSAMPGLIRIRNSGTDQERRGAVIGLAFMPIPQLAINGLLAALNDSDQQVRGLAAQILAKIGTAAAPRVAELLDSPDDRLRSAAQFILGRMGKDAVPALTAILPTKKPLLRANAAWILGEIGPDASSAAPALIRALSTNDIRVLHLVAESIDLIGADPALVQHHLLLIGRKPGTFTMGLIGTEAIPALTALLSRIGTPIAQAAYITLARIGEPAKPALLALLRTGNPSQRISAALLITTIDPRAGHAIPEDLRKVLAGALQEQ